MSQASQTPSLKRPNPYTGPRFVPKRPRIAESNKKEMARIARVEANKNLDLKYFDIDQTAAAIGWDGTVYSLTNGIARGDDNNNFEGESLKPRALQIRMALNQVAANTGTTVFRVIILQSRTVSTPSAASSVLADTGDTTSPLSARLFPRKKIYKFLYDQMFVLDPGMGKCCATNIYIPGKKLAPISFDLGTTTPSFGGLSMIVINDQDQATSLDNVRFYSRITYTD